MRNRGPHKCVIRDGQSMKGIHPRLRSIIAIGFDFDSVYSNKKYNDLSRFPPTPKGDFHVPRPSDVRNESMRNSRMLGLRLDSQVTALTKWHNGEYRIPLRAFYDATTRNKVIRQHFGTPKYPTFPDAEKMATRLRNACTGMLDETEQLIRYLDGPARLEPLATQVAVAHGVVGTCIDLLCRQWAPHTHTESCAPGCMKARNYLMYRVIELKKGYTHNPQFERVRMGYLFPMGAGKPNRIYTVHHENLLQTMMNNFLFRKALYGGKLAYSAALKTGSPLLIRIDKANGLHVYNVPVWALEREDALAKAMGCF